jgi:asparagine synthase (glutamine-hydrolysing)
MLNAYNTLSFHEKRKCATNMGSFVAVAGKNQTQALDDALTMLRALAHRGKSSFGIADCRNVAIKKTIQELYDEDIHSNSLIGYGSSKTLPRDQAQPVKNRDFCLVFEGRIFPPPSRSECTFVSKDLQHIKQKTAHALYTYHGSFVVGTVDKTGVQIGRSPIATVPLYFGDNRKVCAAASERKALRKIGITDILPFPAGCVASLTASGFRFSTVKTINQPSVSMDQAGVEAEIVAEDLKKVMLKAAERHFADLEEIAIAFSGGLDSSLVSVLAKHCSLKISLIWVGLEGQPELNSARQAANALGLPIYTKTYTITDVEKIIPHVLWLIEDDNFIDLTIAVPFYWAAAEAAKLGFKVMATGQGGDELFAGYYRNLKLVNYSGADLNRAILEEVTTSLQSNSQRDNKTSAFHGVELRNPFIDWEVIHFALNIPFCLKISSPDDPLRKRILRLTGETLGIPSIITEKPKKAIQYSTGVEKAIRKLARIKRKTLAKYLADIQTSMTTRSIGGLE